MFWKLFKKTKSSESFTIPELLVTLTVAAILMTALIVLSTKSYSSGKARDAKRVSEINTIRTALQLYYMDFGTYPLQDIRWCAIEEADPFATPASCGNLRTGIAPYLPEIPEDPFYGKGKESEGKVYAYQYMSTSSGQGYKLHVDLETGEAYEISSLVGRNIVYVPPGSTPPPPPPGDWYGGSSDWGYRRKITIKGSQVTGNLTGFPLLVHFTTDVDLVTHAQSNGDDILFTDATGLVKLDHEIEKYDSFAGGELIAWVQADLSAGIDTEIYMYYGNSIAPNQENIYGVWDDNYVAVYHMNQSVGTLEDSTENNNYGTFNGDLPDTITTVGKADGCQDLDGNGDYVSTADANSLDFGTSAFTVSLWLKTSFTTASAIISKFDGIAPPNARRDDYWAFILNADGTITFRLYNRTGDTTGVAYNVITSVGYRYNDNAWHQLVGIRTDSINSAIIADGTTKVTFNNVGMADVNVSTAGGLFTGCFLYLPSTVVSPLAGAIDEIRISNIARSDDWVSTEYNAINSPSAFMTFGVEEGYGG